MKPDTLFKRAFNDTLDLLDAMAEGEILLSENALSHRLGVSRTTVRKIMTVMIERGVTDGDGRVQGVPSARAIERFPAEETVPLSAQVESRFMAWIARDDAQAGAWINEVELARRFGVGTGGIREFLNRFQRFGLITKRPNSGWMLNGFTAEFALELFEIREMFELRSALAFSRLPETHLLWRQIEDLRTEHLALLDAIEDRYRDFSELDNRFHRLVNLANPNRFIDDFYDIISLIFHYHYQWNKQDERERNERAIIEHVIYIEALLTRNVARIEHACRTHLTSARETLIRSTAERAMSKNRSSRHAGSRRAAVAPDRISPQAPAEAKAKKTRPGRSSEEPGR